MTKTVNFNLIHIDDNIGKLNRKCLTQEMRRRIREFILETPKY